MNLNGWFNDHWLVIHLNIKACKKSAYPESLPAIYLEPKQTI